MTAPRPFPAGLFAGRSFAVVGLGKAGLPAAKALLAMGAAVSVWDDKPDARTAAEADGFTVALPDFAAIEALILSPGIAHKLPKPHALAVAAQIAGMPILTDAELLYQAVRAAGSAARFVGITGTNGKSTTTALVAHILETARVAVAAGANLGPAALSLPLLPDGGVYVLEMSSYMLERLATLRFNAAVMLNLSADHIDRHGDIAGYAAAKRHIFDRQTSADLAVIGRDDAFSRAMAAAHGPARQVTISEYDTPLATAPALPGTHNAQNIAAAVALCRDLGLSDAQIAGGIRSYPGLPHRQEIVATTQGGVVWVNDSKATNADSSARALACYDRLIWIAGGMAKEGGIEPLVEFFPRIQHTLLIGRDAPIFAETLARHGQSFTLAETLENAVALAAKLIPSLSPAPQAVLLSPATASWDQFTGYDQRGDHFRHFAQAIAAKEAA